MKTAIPEINTDKLGKLIENDGAKLYKIAEKMNLSPQTLNRMLAGEKIGPRIIARVAKYFGLNMSDLLIRDNKHPNFYNHFQEKEIVYLERIKSFTGLNNDIEYKLSRKFSKSINQISHKIYNCDFKNEEQLTYVKMFLETFNNLDANIGTSKTRHMEDIDNEIKFLKTQLNINEPIQFLEENDIGVYYGHYVYRAMEELVYKDEENVNIQDEPLEYYYCRPTGKRIEVLYFYKERKDIFLPDQIKIFPDTGYTEDELLQNYENSFKKVFLNISSHNYFNIVKQYINYHASNQWLTVPESMSNPEILDDTTDFLHPRFFIHEITNSIWSEKDFQSRDDFNNYVEKKRLMNMAFRNELKSYEHKCNEDPNSVPKYEGPVEIDGYMPKVTNSTETK